MGKPTKCLGKNKGADQLRSNCEADQRLCFRYTDSTIPLLSNSKISSLYPSTVTVQPCLCQTWSEPKLLVFSRKGSIFYNTERIWNLTFIMLRFIFFQYCVPLRFFLKKKIAFLPLFRLQKTLCCIFQKANTCFGRAIQVSILLRFVSKHH